MSVRREGALAVVTGAGSGIGRATAHALAAAGTFPHRIKAMASLHGGYQVTAGIFNLADEAGAARVGGHVRELVETGGGSFAPMAAAAVPAPPSAS